MRRPAVRGWWLQCLLLTLSACGSGDGMVPAPDAREGPRTTPTAPSGRVADTGLPSRVFNPGSGANDLVGDLAGTVVLGQAQLIPARPRVPGDVQPHLTAERRTLVMLQMPPAQSLGTAPVRLRAFDASGNVVGELDMAPPQQLPKQVGFVASDLTEPAAEPRTGAAFEVAQAPLLSRLDDTEAAYLRSVLARESVVHIRLADGRWTPRIQLPVQAREGQQVQVVSTAAYPSQVAYTLPDGAPGLFTVRAGSDTVFRFEKGGWVGPTEREHSRYVYGHGFWSASLPAAWVQPGMAIAFEHGGRQGRLSPVAVGPPTELLLHVIDIGMLTPPRGAFTFADDRQGRLHADYFQTLPVSQLVVSRYEPLYLTEVVLPDGQRLSGADPGEGGWHSGTLRQRIGKELISLGINNANIGLWSTPGVGESSHPYIAAQITAHNSVGMYRNGRQVHGGSGGGGMVTLELSIGNEFSHEMGHNFQLGHFVGGAKGSMHRPAQDVNAAWGWDSRTNRFIPNFAPDTTGKPTCWTADPSSQECVPPFLGHSFGLDAMAGGQPLWPQANAYTLYTPYVLAQIQRDLESKVVFGPASPTGFWRWDAQRGQRVPYVHRVPDPGAAAGASPAPSLPRQPRRFGVPVTTLVGYYDPQAVLPSHIYPALHGGYGYVYADDSARLGANSCELQVQTAAGVQRFQLHAHRLEPAHMNRFHVNIAAQDSASAASVLCHSQTLTSRALLPRQGSPSHTVQRAP